MAATALMLAAPAAAGAAQINVDSTGDSANRSDGDCTLREAIENASDNIGGEPGECEQGEAGLDTIKFGLLGPGGNTYVFTPATAYATIDDPIEIDGSSPVNPQRDIEIDGSVSTGSTLLRLAPGSGGSTLQRIALYDHTNNGGIGPAVSVQSDGNELLNVLIGEDWSGASHPNVHNGLSISGSGNDVTNGVVSESGSTGIQVTGPDTAIFNVSVGVNRVADTDRGNSGSGITLFDTADRTVITGNMISGNDLGGVFLDASNGDDELEDVEITNNYIGLAASGVAAIGNDWIGVQGVGGLRDLLIDGNRISGNAQGGISLTSTESLDPGVAGPTGTVITDNNVGTDANGTTEISNGGKTAIAIDSGIDQPANGDTPGIAAGNRIGGTTGLGVNCAGDCNLIAGAGDPGEYGVRVGLDSINAAPINGTQVLGNRIGITGPGGTAMPNHRGVFAGNGDGTVIGSPAGPNVIGASTSDGVSIGGDDVVSDITVQSNLIGAESFAHAAQANGGHGIDLTAAAPVAVEGGLIGGAVEADEENEIGFNGLDGISLANSAFPSFPSIVDVAMLGNKLSFNGSAAGDLGIDLRDDGVSANDGLGDFDDGPNHIQNFPEVQAVVDEAGTTTVVGRLHSEENKSYRLEFFSSATPTPPSEAEAMEFIGSTEVTTNADGSAGFERDFEVATDTRHVTATATELGAGGKPLSTSELSPGVLEGCDVQGTAGDDIIQNSPGDEVICLLGGDDTVELLDDEDDDIIIGGSGKDTVDYSGAISGAEVNLAQAFGSASGATQRLVGMENVIGSGHADTLRGDGAKNVLDGAAGQDALTGKGGNDTLKGRAGAKDRLKGGGGNDKLKGGGGNKDNAKGGGGNDLLVGGGGGGDVCAGGGGGKDKAKASCEHVSGVP